MALLAIRGTAKLALLLLFYCCHYINKSLGPRVVCVLQLYTEVHRLALHYTTLSMGYGFNQTST